MAAYHFEGVCESGFGVSGILEAEDDIRARQKARRFCDTVRLLQVFDGEPATQEALAEEAAALKSTAFSCETWKRCVRSLRSQTASLVDVFFRERPFRKRPSRQARMPPGRG
jgi:hypothetical protein